MKQSEVRKSRSTLALLVYLGGFFRRDDSESYGGRGQRDLSWARRVEGGEVRLLWKKVWDDGESRVIQREGKVTIGLGGVPFFSAQTKMGRNSGPAKTDTAIEGERPSKGSRGQRGKGVRVRTCARFILEEKQLEIRSIGNVERRLARSLVSSPSSHAP